MSLKLATIATYTSTMEAEMAQSLLESEGIRAHLEGEASAVLGGQIGNALSGVKLQVGEQDVQTAMEILEEQKSIEITEEDWKIDGLDNEQDETTLESSIPAGVEKVSDSFSLMECLAFYIGAILVVCWLVWKLLGLIVAG